MLNNSYLLILPCAHGEVQFLYMERNNLLLQTNKMKNVLVCFVTPPPNSHVEAPTLSISECDYIWR